MWFCHVVSFPVDKIPLLSHGEVLGKVVKLKLSLNRRSDAVSQQPGSCSRAMKWETCSLLSLLFLCWLSLTLYSSISPRLFQSYFIFVTSSKTSELNHYFKCFTFYFLQNKVLSFWFSMHCKSITAWSKISWISLRTTTRNHLSSFDENLAVIVCFKSRTRGRPRKRDLLPTETDSAPRAPNADIPLGFGPRVPQQSTGLPSGYWTDTASPQSNPEHRRKPNFRTSWLPDKAGWMSSYSWIHTCENELVSKVLTSIL